MEDLEIFYILCNIILDEMMNFFLLMHSSMASEEFHRRIQLNSIATGCALHV